MKDVSKHFTDEEVKCNCGCGYGSIRHELLYRLEVARCLAMVPFIIRSWCRCDVWNKEIGGSVGSSHVLGLAVDIEAIDPNVMLRILFSLVCAGFNRIGIGKDFIHVDCDAAKTPNIIWFY